MTTAEPDPELPGHFDHGTLSPVTYRALYAIIAALPTTSQPTVFKLPDRDIKKK